MASDWGVFLFLTTLPLFMKEVLQFDISTVYYVLKLKSNKNNKIMLCLKNKERTTLSVALCFLLAFSS